MKMKYEVAKRNNMNIRQKLVTKDIIK